MANQPTANRGGANRSTGRSQGIALTMPNLASMKVGFDIQKILNDPNVEAVQVTFTKFGRVITVKTKDGEQVHPQEIKVQREERTRVNALLNKVKQFNARIKSRSELAGISQFSEESDWSDLTLQSELNKISPDLRKVLMMNNRRYQLFLAPPEEIHQVVQAKRRQVSASTKADQSTSVKIELSDEKSDGSSA